jgi:hypothetical protein
MINTIMTKQDQDNLAKLYLENFEDLGGENSDIENGQNDDWEKVIWNFFKTYGALNVDVINTRVSDGVGNTKIFIHDENGGGKKLVYDEDHEYGHGYIENF